MNLGDPAIDPHVADSVAVSAALALLILGAIVALRRLRRAT